MNPPPQAAINRLGALGRTRVLTAVRCSRRLMRRQSRAGLAAADVSVVARTDSEAALPRVLSGRELGSGPRNTRASRRGLDARWFGGRRIGAARPRASNRGGAAASRREEGGGAGDSGEDGPREKAQAMRVEVAELWEKD